jgi:predicted glycogen debranching enzyme
MDARRLDFEWLEADGLGGFASGTVGGAGARRYHALLLPAAHPPADRYVLVNAMEVAVATPQGRHELGSHLYDPGVVHPGGASLIESFTADPWPTWIYRLEDGLALRQEILCLHHRPATLVRWSLLGDASGVSMEWRLLMSGRGFHSLQRQNGAFRFQPEEWNGGLRWRPYDGVPATLLRGSGAYEHAPDWYRSFLYEEERARGLDCIEDLASPGIFRSTFESGFAWMLLEADLPGGAPSSSDPDPDPVAIVEAERSRRSAFASPLLRSADAYLARRGGGSTILAGYPWFGDWGRDTFIALRGLCLAVGRLDEAKAILLEWAGTVSGGMLPNRFPDQGEQPEYNSVDASLWYVIACRELASAAASAGSPLSVGEEDSLARTVASILVGYARGTRYGIRLDSDGLLMSGEPGVQLTWMDAKVGDWVVTPRTGKAVEIQALWLNALDLAGSWSPLKSDLFDRGLRSFRERFTIQGSRHLKDVVDVDHVPGREDASFRPNQIFAAGGLPVTIVDDATARTIVDAVEERLLTPLGLRSLAPGEPGYAPRYEGGVRERDGAYHQGTVWPWLIGPFVEAWVRVRGGSRAAKAEARQRFLAPLMDHLGDAGLGHISEIADAEAPFTPRGCPFQAWSVGEALRLDRKVLSASSAAAARATRKRRDSSASQRGRRAL